MIAIKPQNLFGPVMFWTVVTTLFTVLPLARILARPDGYTWTILGVSGEGFDGPFWIFIAATAYAVALLYCAQRAPRLIAHVMLILWHMAVTAIIFTALFRGGADATWQGQGLHWEIPIWTVAAPFACFTALAVTWVVLDHCAAPAPTAPWTRANTMRLALSLALLAAALALFRAGENYNWVTATAIIVTIAHWILLGRAFEPLDGHAERPPVKSVQSS